MCIVSCPSQYTYVFDGIQREVWIWNTRFNLGLKTELVFQSRQGEDMPC